MLLSPLQRWGMFLSVCVMVLNAPAVKWITKAHLSAPVLPSLWCLPCRCLHQASVQLSQDASKTSLFDSSRWSFHPEREQSRSNNTTTVLCLTTYTSITINRPLCYQSEFTTVSEAFYQITATVLFTKMSAPVPFL